jgi:nickel superoxide dismutase
MIVFELRGIPLHEEEEMLTPIRPLLLASALIMVSNAWLGAHCQIPCGIYDDQARFDAINEDVTTIEKAMNQIKELSSADPVNYNQLVRWITNKEEHATKIQTIVSEYFMTQRIKPDAENYAEKIGVLHRLLIAAMECKQSIDLSHVEEVRSLLKKFEGLYFTQANE